MGRINGWVIVAGLGILPVGYAALLEGRAGDPRETATVAPPTTSIAPLPVGGPPLTDRDLAGIWWVESIDGYEIEWGRFTAEVPWVEFADASLIGNLGCNSVSADAEVMGSRLKLVAMEAGDADCSDPTDAENMMWTERTLGSVTEQEEGFEVRVDGLRMTWNDGRHEVLFVAEDRRPEPGRPPPVQQVDRLDCSPGDVRETSAAADGQEPEQLAIDADPAVVTVEVGDPLQWWGLDGEGRVVVGVFLGDAVGADYQIFSCD